MEAVDIPNTMFIPNCVTCLQEMCHPKPAKPNQKQGKVGGKKKDKTKSGQNLAWFSYWWKRVEWDAEMEKCLLLEERRQTGFLAYSDSDKHSDREKNTNVYYGLQEIVTVEERHTWYDGC